MKRLLDIVVSLTGLLVLSPLLLLVSAAIYFYDFHSPFYIATRVGKNFKPFKMVKFRSMVVNADKTGVTSTSATDKRITPIGHLVRRYKLDEVVQLWNVLKGDMSLVGPRPNVESGTKVYTEEEKKLLAVKPGITDFASIVFADEGEILRGHPDADRGYDELIRPWKSRLGLFYIRHMNVLLDLKLAALTLLAIVSRPLALRSISNLLSNLEAPGNLVRISLRQDQLVPHDPP